MNIEQYRKECGWSLRRMAHEADIDFNTLKRAISGENVSGDTARKIAKAISSELKQDIRYTQIEGLNVNL
jgi:transcriptional regulator with XRE-family HTH domain